MPYFPSLAVAEYTGMSLDKLQHLLRGYGAIVFILGVGLAGLIVLLSVIAARRARQRRRAKSPEVHRRAYSDAWASAGARLEPPAPPEGEEESGEGSGGDPQ